MAKFCTNCGFRMEDNAAFCTRCGRPMTQAQPQQQLCPYCGRVLIKNDRFCTGCGRPIKAVQQPTYQQPPQIQAQPQQRVQPQPVYQQQPIKKNEKLPGNGTTQIQSTGKKKHAIVWIILAAVIPVAVFCFLAFFTPGFGRNWFRKTEKLKNGFVELDEFSFDFSVSDLRDGSVSLSKDHKPDVLSKEGLVSDLYEMTIEGECSDPVTITMKVPKEYTGKKGQTLMLAVGTDYDISTNGEIGRNYYYVETEVDGDTATAVIVPEEVFEPKLLCRENTDTARSSADSKTSKKKYTGSRVVRFGETLRNVFSGENPRFILSYPYFYTVSDSDTKAFIKDLEDMWDWYASKGYSFEGLQPLWIYIVEGSDGDLDGYFTRTWTGPKIEFQKKFIFGTGKSSDYSGTKHLARPLMYHEFFHAIQDQYIGTSKHSYWFDEATSTYYEHYAQKRFGISGTYKFAKTTEENREAALHSMVPESGLISSLEANAESVSSWEEFTEKTGSRWYSKIGEEGYARGPFCDMVSEIKGNDDWIREIYEGWKTGGVDLKSIEKVADSIPDLAFKLYQRFVNGTYVETGRKAYSRLKSNIYISKENLETLKNGTKKSITVTGKTFEINGQGAVVVCLGIQNKDLFKDDVKYNVSISIQGKDIAFETYELQENSATAMSNNTIRDIYKSTILDKKNYGTLVVSKKPFETVDEFTVVYEITLNTDEEKPELEDGLKPSDVEGVYDLSGSGTKVEIEDLEGVMVKDEKVVSDVSAVMTVKAVSDDEISIDITGAVSFSGTYRLKPDGKVEISGQAVSLSFHRVNGISAILFWKTDELDVGFTGGRK